ncbi:SulP family inorganic anion transporter [Streptomyces sp. V1I6]|uniref:SulP family inorganic anion transporter n=1 Tax=Streptomyces sp. V1I6 TaxID=3042273 RepID=UPI0027822E69|nr:SulP family inorganic anion transporter [Streptomyces sp. V1I6]MDQ0846261.1 MFS superfamily sulfate permease-like transporter [Streptomyces sp. V1I6]
MTSPTRKRARHARPPNRTFPTRPATGNRPVGGPSGRRPTLVEELRGASLVTEIVASFVVFLVALPLCIGVAVASGAPAELGIVSGVVGGLVVGLMRGSTLQVSGPAAGLAALVAEAVAVHGLATLGVIVLATGILQIALALIKLGRMFQAISVAVVQGMLAGIGLPLMISQSYVLADSKAPGSPVENALGLPGLVATALSTTDALIATALGLATVALCFVWKKVPGPVAKVPAPLVAVAVGMAVAALPGVRIDTLRVGDLTASVHFPGAAEFASLADPAVMATVLTFTVIASAESLFTAAAVDRMHTGPRTRYNSELLSQGVGNTVCGSLGALPMTAVVARSSANVQAGAKTRLSRTLHGLWLLGFALLLPGLLALIPITVLAGVLVHSGFKLLAPEQFPRLWKQDKGEAVVMVVTTFAIFGTALLEGVLIGLAAGVVLAVLRMSRTTVRHSTDGDTAKLTMTGSATFIRLPQLLDALDAVAAAGSPRIRLDLTAMTHLDHACRTQIDEFVAQQRRSGTVRVELLLPGGPNGAPAVKPGGPQPGNGVPGAAGEELPDLPYRTERPAPGRRATPSRPGVEPFAPEREFTGTATTAEFDVGEWEQAYVGEAARREAGTPQEASHHRDPRRSDPAGGGRHDTRAPGPYDVFDGLG